jgi:hypothetical protein
MKSTYTWRTIANAHARHEAVNVSEFCSSLEKWIDATAQPYDFLAARESQRESNSYEFVCVTDAARDGNVVGMGAVLLKRVADGNLVLHDSWSSRYLDNKAPSINVLEMEAMLAGLQLLEEASAQPEPSVLMVTDSQVCRHVLVRKRTRSTKLRSYLQAIYQILGSRQAAVMWVPSRDNPADAPSRGKDIDEEVLEKMKEGIGWDEGFDLGRSVCLPWCVCELC